MVTKYEYNCPILEEAGYHYINRNGGEKVCTNCKLEKCVLDTGGLIKSNYQEGRRQVIEKVEQIKHDVPTYSVIEGTNVKIPEPPALYILKEDWQSLLKELEEKE